MIPQNRVKFRIRRMDNLTHTLIGITFGQSVVKKQDKDLRAMVWASVIASNLPDIDVLFNPMSDARRLGYLLYHRGYTHTLVAMLPLALLSALLPYFLFRNHGRASFLKIFAVAVMAGLLHLAADYCNDYGLHPFYPFMNRWYYGDFIFIIEPFYLFALMPLAILRSHLRWVRVFWALFGVVMLVFLWVTSFLPWAACVWLTIWAGAFFFWQKKSTTALPAIAGMAVTLLLFFSASVITRSQVRDELKVQRPQEQLLQLSTTPAPSNPFCWRTIVATRSDAGEYRLHMGAVSLLSALFDPSRCFFRLQQERTAPLSQSVLLTHKNIFWLGDFSAPLSELKGLTEKHCQLRALLRFTRMPFWVKEGSTAVVGDLRYDNEPGLGFSELEFSGDQEVCPKLVPPWVSPIPFESLSLESY